ncbi:putative reverse transcriptase zinc-binding domain-containing protein [Helianthus annuus]|nr:putative reverse transcriptase zinc-binding domain-containing protein [Helianthus annuus]
MRDLSTTVELDQKSQCEEMLSTTTLSAQEDDWSWVPDSSKGFSVRSIRKLCADTIPGEEGHVFPWNRWLPKKVNIFRWRALMERLPTRDALRKNEFRLSPTCVLFVKRPRRLLITYSQLAVSLVKFGRRLRRGVNSLRCSHSQSVISFCTTKQSKGNKEHIGMVKSIMLLGCWSLWKARNELIFNQKKTKAAAILQQVKALGIFRWIKARAKWGLMTEEQWRTLEFG